jgi:hypothetical protein
LPASSSAIPARPSRAASPAAAALSRDRRDDRARRTHIRSSGGSVAHTWIIVAARTASASAVTWSGPGFRSPTVHHLPCVRAEVFEDLPGLAGLGDDVPLDLIIDQQYRDRHGNAHGS